MKFAANRSLRYRHAMTDGLPTSLSGKLRGALRWTWQNVVFWLGLLLFIPTLLTVMIVSLGRARHSIGCTMLRAWGQTMLEVLGVHLVVQPELAAALATRQRRIVVFNHTSTVDMFLFPAIWVPGMTVVAKREMAWLPLVGLGCWLMGFHFINRKNPETARASMKAAAEEVRRSDLSLLMAPEGTRSRTGHLNPFKLGAFYASADADAPIVAIVVRGLDKLFPRHWHYCRPGTVTLELLTVMPSGASDPSSEAIHARAEYLRSRYQAALNDFG